MTAANLRELGFTKMGHHEDDDWPEGYFILVLNLETCYFIPGVMMKLKKTGDGIFKILQ